VVFDHVQADVIAQDCNAEEFGNDYRFGFNGQEKDNEVKGIGNSINYLARIYDSRLGRFMSIDPLTNKFPYYTPYQFAGNTPIQAIDLDGAEPAPPEAGKRNLLVVVQGFVAHPKEGNTQTKNAVVFSPKNGSDMQGLGQLESLGNKHTDLQVVNFASGAFTTGDVRKTIGDFRAANPNGKIIGVGHSYGAQQLIKAADGNKIDLLLSIDAQDLDLFGTSDNVPSSVRSTINYYSESGMLGPGGNKLKFDGKYGINRKISGSSHTSIDDILSTRDGEGNINTSNSILKQDIENELNNNAPTGNAGSRDYSNLSK
jgi:RHS repeat-associated protein